MKKLILSLVFVIPAANVVAQENQRPGFSLPISDDCFGEKAPQLKQILIDRYGTLVMSLKIKAKQELEIVEQIAQENPAIMDELNKNTEESIRACQELANHLQGQEWFVSDEWVPHIKIIKNEVLKQLPQLLSLYLQKTSLIQSDLKKIGGIIADLRNPSEKVKNLSVACLVGMTKNNGKLDENLQNKLLELQEGNELLACLLCILDGVITDEAFTDRLPTKTGDLAKKLKLVPFVRETLSELGTIATQALDARLQQA